MKKVSVIVPMYNCEKVIDRCVESLLAQSGAELEILLIDNGIDDPGGLVRRYGDKIRLLKAEQKGASSARNVGLKAAEGDFVMFVDADDCLAGDCLEAALKKQEETGADIVRMNYVQVFNDELNSKPLHVFDREKFIEKKDFPKEIYPFFVEGIRLNTIWATLYKRSVLDGIEFNTEMKIANDIAFSMMAYTNAETVCILPKDAYMYHCHGIGLTGSASTFEKYKYNFKISSQMLKLLPRWGMDSPKWRLKVIFRPLRLTFDKLRRLRAEKRLRKAA